MYSKPSRPSKASPHATSMMSRRRDRAAIRLQEGGGLAGATARGEYSRRAWVADGEVVAARALADAWGFTSRALRLAERRGEVFAVVVSRRRYYPCEFVTLARDKVAAICTALGPMHPVEKLVFWKRRHGALRGKTVLEAIDSNKGGSQLRTVVRLAQAVSAPASAVTELESADSAS